MRYNLIVELPHWQDWLFGEDNGINKLKGEDWTSFLPAYEGQRFENFDSMDCVTRSGLNCLETEFNYKIANKLFSEANIKWLNDQGYIENGKVNFNDSFNAALSGTTERGNTFKNVADSFRKDGLIPERMYQSGKGLTFKQYVAQPPSHLILLGQEFLTRFNINYEIVYRNKFEVALDYAPVQVGVFAWNLKNGIYVNNGSAINHGVMLFKQDHIFDSYEPHIKQLAPEFNYMSYGYQYTASQTITLINKFKNMLQKICRDVHGGFWFLKDKRRQKIETPIAIMGALIDEFGARTLNDDELRAFNETSEFFGAQTLTQKIKSLF